MNGSPRPNGDSASLLRRAEAHLTGERMIVNAYRSDIAPCTDCRACKARTGCVIEDGMQAVYEYIQVCDSILIVSPIYFSELTGRLLDVASRLQTYFCARYYRGEIPIAKVKRGAVLLAGGGAGAPERAYKTARILLRLMNCGEIYPLVCSHDTDHCPAAEDEAALGGAEMAARFLNREL